jgi:hypothetical protein
MSPRALLLATALAALALSCSEEMSLPPLEDEPPPFEFSMYLEKGVGPLVPGMDVRLVRRPKHLEHVYALTLDVNHKQPGFGQATTLFTILKKQFEGAGLFVANQVFSLRCAAVELPDCVPKWGFIEELLGPGDGPGALELRRTLADAFEKRARELKMENTLVLATVNVLLTRGMLKSALGNAAAAEARAAAQAEQRAVVDGLGKQALAPDPLPPSPGLVEALTGKNPTPPATPGPRLPQDVSVNPKIPQERATTRPIGPSVSQNAQLQVDINYLRKMGATNIRVNQQQLTQGNSGRVGINRPDLQFDYKSRRYHVEYDSPTSSRGSGHQTRTTSNDPDAEVILLIAP